MQRFLKIKKQSMVQIFMVLSISAMSFTTKAEMIQTIELGEKAPISGVLMPEITYKQMMSDVVNKQYLKSELDQCLERGEQYSESNQVAWFAAGAATGLITAVTLLLLK